MCYTGIRRNVIYGTKTEKKQKVDIVGNSGDTFGCCGGSDVLGVG